MSAGSYFYDHSRLTSPPIDAWDLRAAKDIFLRLHTVGVHLFLNQGHLRIHGHIPPQEKRTEPATLHAGCDVRTSTPSIQRSRKLDLVPLIVHVVAACIMPVGISLIYYRPCIENEEALQSLMSIWHLSYLWYSMVLCVFPLCDTALKCNAYCGPQILLCHHFFSFFSRLVTLICRSTGFLLIYI